ncbi:MAG TPA: TrbI/VirB10 family protein [Candidatus Saccharimonadales bacterium]|nr:TrbI/VirB10 family protein [Candidatus Saccharimonadales bacterium]
MTPPAAIQDKAPKPAGLLPTNVQSWLLISLAVLMVIIMWLTGGKKPPAATRAVPPGPAVQAPLEVNEAKIVDLQNRIQQLQREQIVAQSALAAGGGTEVQPAAVPSSANGNQPGRTEDPIEAERKKRNYLSLFSSNVALTYRKTLEAARASDPDAVPLPLASAEETAARLALPVLPAGNPTPAKDSAAESQRKEATHTPVSAPAGAPAAATGKTYVLFEGTILETVLVNRLDGQMTGPVECLVSNDVYSHDRQHLLIPAGAKLLGESRKVDSLGQTRIAVSFHRLVMPDGYSTSLDHFQGLNQIGDAGLRDQVNSHYLRIFGASLAIGAIGAIAEGGASATLTASGTDLMRQGFAQSTAQSSAQILDRFLSILPTVTIREGHRVKVYLSGDLALPDYTNHTMPSNL